MKKIAVLVSGGGTNLQAIIDRMEAGGINGEISLVLSSRKDAYALERAQKHGIRTVVVEKKDFDSIEEFNRAMLGQLGGIDLVVLAGFMSILTKEFVSAFPNRIINVHPSLIPAFCGKGYYGLHVHEKVLEYGVKLTGATVHFVNEETDGGPIIAQKAVAVQEGDTPETLQKRVMQDAEHKILPDVVAAFCDDKIKVCGRWVRMLD